MLEPPFPDLDELLTAMGKVGKRLSEIDASEGSAGNISICVRWSVEPRRYFPLIEPIDLPQPVPELAGAVFLVTGSGRRLREIIEDPVSNIGCLIVNDDGRTGMLYTSYTRLFQRLTSEFNSHLAVHYDQVLRTGTNFHAIVHAQPPYLTFLSHIPRYNDVNYLNRHLLRWQPETIVQLPEGIGFVPFHVPGSAELMQATVEALRTHRIVIWAKHGVMARSDVSVKRASDRIEYAETAARYEYMNLTVGEQGNGLSLDEIRAICTAFSVQQTIFK
ncbi:MAG: class II aldolase/adducin family protein [Thermanaerothrix sp.]|nr:class II aldolase/adducin family protein [Thermanaerothrix sp.]